MNENNFKALSFTILLIQSEHWNKWRRIFKLLSESTTQSWYK